jgi:NADH-quinone oxidoreductase subunit K
MFLQIIDLLSISLFLFFIGFFGILFTKKNIITFLISIEIMLLGLNLALISFSIFLDDSLGLIFSILILTIAAAESAIGLAILVMIYHTHNTILLEHFSLLRL